MHIKRLETGQMM